MSSGVGGGGPAIRGCVTANAHPRQARSRQVRMGIKRAGGKGRRTTEMPCLFDKQIRAQAGTDLSLCRRNIESFVSVLRYVRHYAARSQAKTAPPPPLLCFPSPVFKCLHNSKTKQSIPRLLLRLETIFFPAPPSVHGPCTHLPMHPPIHSEANH